mgnify:CR=1 FL=1
MATTPHVANVTQQTFDSLVLVKSREIPVLADFWPHGAVAQAYGVFNDDAGIANRGTFVIDRSGVIRFAECNGPGEARDQKSWTEALAALKA